MSSNIELEKICEYCNQKYIARTLYTRYCSHTCNSRAYKANKRKEKIAAYGTLQKKETTLSIFNSELDKHAAQRELLSVTECCALIGISRGTIFRWIKSGLLITHQHGTKHLIKREDINKLFNNGKQ